ncbi:MAG: flagellar type III secretion system pore protein FliP [Planctomycetota bacterium]
MRSRVIRIPAFLGAVAVLAAVLAGPAAAQEFQIPALSPNLVRPAQNPQEVSVSLQIVFFLTMLSFAPAILVLTTSFTRIVVVLSFLRRALSTQDLPPNQVVVGLALFLTFMIMAPVWEEANREALQPMLAGKISQGEAFQKGLKPLREFMYRNTRAKDLKLFIDISKMTVKPEMRLSDVPTRVLIPAFATSELRRSFEMGFLLYLPFLVIDMVVSSVLMSMGMLMLPPIVISMPFKILLFVLVDGWWFVIGELVKSFR